MQLHSLEIQNYRSLEHVQLDNLSKFNVLIGRNNSGKSSVFGALELLSKISRGETSVDATMLTDHEMSRSLKLRLVLTPQRDERLRFLQRLKQAGLQEARADAVDRSPFFRQLEYTFATYPAQPQLMQLQQVRVLAEDNALAQILEIGKKDQGVANPEYFYATFDSAVQAFPHVLSADLLASPSRGRSSLRINVRLGAQSAPSATEREPTPV